MTGASCPPGAMPDVALEPDDDATILYTSGTTGKPKGALGTHRNMMSQHHGRRLRRRRAISCAAASRCPSPIRYAPQRSTLLSVPFFHATGMFCRDGTDRCLPAARSC